MRSGSHAHTTTPLELLQDDFAELSDAMADLESNFLQLQLMHESLARFSESFAAFLYGMNMNAFCVDFPEVRLIFVDLAGRWAGHDSGEDGTCEADHLLFVWLLGTNTRVLQPAAEQPRLLLLNRPLQHQGSGPQRPGRGSDLPHHRHLVRGEPAQQQDDDQIPNPRSGTEGCQGEGRRQYS
jgi:hypothetical protein